MEVPVGDKCEACFQTWKQAFAAQMTFDAMAEGVKKNPYIKMAFKQAQQSMADPSSKSWRGSQVCTQTSHVLEISKHYLALSEKELKKKFLNGKSGKIPKALLQTLPSVHIQGPDGEAEEIFLFKHPSKPFRSAVIKSAAQQCLSTEVMSAATHQYEHQGQDVFKHIQSSSMDEQGLKTVLNKEPHIVTLEEFCEKNAFKRPQADIVKDEETDLEDEEEEASLMNLVGSAAATIQRSSSAGSLQDMGIKRASSMTTPKQTKSTSWASQMHTPADGDGELDEGDAVGSVSGKDSLLTSLDRSGGDKSGEQWRQ